jgi:hypothetical protein
MAEHNECPICYDKFREDTNFPMTCIPNSHNETLCGHNICEPCLRIHRQSNNYCPICKIKIYKVVKNRDLMIAISNSKENDDGNYAGESKTGNMGLFNLSHKSDKQKEHEIISDRSVYSVYVIDNSTSMLEPDGKSFSTNDDDSIQKRGGITRWEECIETTKQISKYNIKRGMKATYYLLNPDSVDEWEENIDFVTIDPSESGYEDQCEVLWNDILHLENVNGSTPLDVITKKLRHSLKDLVRTKEYKHVPINYIIITDGEPNNTLNFENELKILADTYSIFLTINLCTDNDQIVEYYNDLDQKLGKEMGGIDVLDDFEAEQNEILQIGNNFFVYTYDIHICRLAGCNSIIADSLDEIKFPPHYVVKLCNELTNIDNAKSPHWSENGLYIEYLKEKCTEINPVYNYKHKRFEPIINISNVNKMLLIDHYQSKVEKIKEEYGSYLFVMIVFILALLLW